MIIKTTVAYVLIITLALALAVFLERFYYHRAKRRNRLQGRGKHPNK